MKNFASRPVWIPIISIFTLIFGAATLFEGGKALFTDAGRIAAGNIVPFVLWFNFIAGFFYLIAGINILLRTSCAKRLSAILALSSLIVLIALGVHVLSGKPYEIRTVAAMTLRTAVWISIAIALFRSKQFLATPSCNC